MHTVASRWILLIYIRKDISDRELSHIFMGPVAVLDDFTGIKNALVNCLFILNWS